MNRRFITILGVCALFFSGRSQVLCAALYQGKFPTPDTDQKIASASSGADALRTGQFEAAIPLLKQELEASKTNADRLNVQFLLGRACVARADQLKGPDRTKLLADAERWYGDALKSQGEHPTSGVLNNLALALAKLGDDQKAADSFQQAINLGDDRQALCLINYGEFLAGRGQPDDAARVYEQAIRLPGGEAALAKLTELTAEKNPSAMPATLRRLADAGSVLAVQKAALELLITGRAGPNPGDVLSVVVYCLSQQSYDRLKFADSEPGLSLKAAAEKNAALGDPIASLLSLHATPPKQGTPQLKWWAQPSKDSRRGEDLRALLRNLGDEELKPPTQLDVEKRQVARIAPPPPARAAAEAYFLCSLTLVANEPDPDSLLQVAQLYVKDTRTVELNKLIEDLGRSLYEMKGEAIRSGNVRRAYQFHRSLGVVYAGLQKWDGGVASASYQLSHALKAATDSRDKEASTGLPPIAIEPTLVELLAKSYDEIKKPDAAINVRLQYASETLKQGNIEATHQLLDSAGASPTLNDTQRTELARLQKQLAQPDQSQSVIASKTPDNIPSVITLMNDSLTSKVTVNGSTFKYHIVNEPKWMKTGDLSDFQALLGDYLVKNGSASAKSFVLLNARTSPSDLESISFDGSAGSILVKHGDSQQNVKFFVEASAGGATIKPFSVQRPADLKAGFQDKKIREP